ncbi:Uncharacterized protein OS=Phaeodactylibacter xiamenensis GN=IX84_27095 PE=4 SV=1: Reg_prop [Gemmata massiliana]|uniref:Uncharacterized protein n=1 Tax=Gemmata massiliana TaxID=1210884 RepID=A0A6P2D247_9BACT|nr:two-component regulator propeller domain-containing protein [Gemmata massiliana]VTR94154.1 Uncharacterized protein OS=Phaeodactylibacter xiamenensis GN=IX84_27095 PE=4 SV=1: Reg_prop [Gemmata massiliana]
MFTRFHHALAALSLLSACASGQDKQPAEKGAKGEVVTELGKSVMYVMQAKNDTYWFGSNDRGAYRYDGKSLVNFTTKDGLVSNQIRGVQEDKSGNVYFATYEGISRFDGRAFTTLAASEKADPKEWNSDRTICGSWGRRISTWSSGTTAIRCTVWRCRRRRSATSDSNDSRGPSSRMRDRALTTLTPS